MNFTNIDRKVREMNFHLANLIKMENIDDFESCFGAFIGAARSVTMSVQVSAGITFDKSGNIQKQGNIPGFAE